MGSCLSRILTTSRAIPIKTIDNEDSSLYVLPLPREILQYISATFLSSDAAASLALCSRSMLNILGDQALRSLRLESHTIERTRFLEILEKDLPDWLFCHDCSLFHPVDQDGDPSQLWRNADEAECVQVNGVVSIRFDFHIRFEHAQLLMRNYRLGRPYEINLKKLSSNFVLRLPEEILESVVTANIAAGELVLQIKYSLRLIKHWDISLIRTTIRGICPHLVDCYIDSIFAQALRCRLSHGNGLPCIECKKQKHCLECSTSFHVDTRTLDDLVTEVQVDVWRCLGSCKSPFDSKWRTQANPCLQHISRRHEARGTKRSRICRKSLSNV